MTGREVAAVGLGLLLGFGCTIDEAADIAAYRQVLDGGLPRPELPAEGVALELSTTLRLANAQDELLAQAGESYVRSLVDRERRAAAFLPRLAFGPTLFARERTSRSTDPRGADVELDARLGVSPVADTARHTAGSLLVGAERAHLRAAQEELLLDVARAWFVVRAAESRHAVLQASLVVQEARVDDARGRAAAGLKRPLDVALAESRVADARARIVDALSEAKNARHLLSFFLGFDVTSRALGQEPDLGVGECDEATLIERGQRNRPDLREAQWRTRAAELDVEAAYGAYWPSVALDLGVFFARDSEPAELDWTSALRISLPLFEAGLIEADVRDALSRLREARLEQSRRSRSLVQEVRIARDTLHAVRARENELRMRERAARSAFDLAVAQEAVGLASNLERLTAQDDLLSVELELAESRIEARLRALELERAVGGLRGIAGIPQDQSPDA